MLFLKNFNNKKVKIDTTLSELKELKKTIDELILTNEIVKEKIYKIKDKQKQIKILKEYNEKQIILTKNIKINNKYFEELIINLVSEKYLEI